MKIIKSSNFCNFLWSPEEVQLLLLCGKSESSRETEKPQTISKKTIVEKRIENVQKFQET